MQLSTSINLVPDSWVDALFAKMAAYYGNKFSDMWRDSDLQTIKSVWAQEMGKLTREEITRGANALASQEWCPTLPQFIKLCKINVDPLVAYYEAVEGVTRREQGEVGIWTHPAIFWASVKVGAFDLKNSSYSSIRARWEKALDEQMQKGQWDEIPKPMIALPAPAGEINKEIVDKFITETQVIKNQESKTDHKLWAKRILQRVKDGDKTVTVIQRQFATEAIRA